MPQLAHAAGLESVAGFRSIGLHAGIKKERPDIALIVSDRPGTTGAAVFTQNAFAGAPVHVSRQHLVGHDVRAIVINSGNANACTGRQGLRDALAMAKTAASGLGVTKEQILVASTGIIGRPLPMDKVVYGIEAATAHARQGTRSPATASTAILTTDSGPKTAGATFEANGIAYRIQGVAKGAGMIHPNMATMLAFLVTDAPIAGPDLQSALSSATQSSFNMISVDGDESTNDMAAILANGAAGGPPIGPTTPVWPEFQAAVDEVCTSLARQIAADGEGATRLMQVTVQGLPDEEARSAARGIASSNLVKAAVHGADPNWGRILSSLGQYVTVDPGTVDLHIGDGRTSVQVLHGGEPDATALRAAADLLQASEVHLKLVISNGDGQAVAWGCDLTEDYVTFNSEYST